MAQSKLGVIYTEIPMVNFKQQSLGLSKESLFDKLSLTYCRKLEGCRIHYRDLTKLNNNLQISFLNEAVFGSKDLSVHCAITSCTSPQRYQFDILHNVAFHFHGLGLHDGTSAFFLKTQSNCYKVVNFVWYSLKQFNLSPKSLTISSLSSLSNEGRNDIKLRVEPRFKELTVVLLIEFYLN